MKNGKRFKAMIAKYLVVAMCVSLAPGNVWAQTLKDPMLKYQVNATSSNAEDFIEEDEEEIMCDEDLSTDSDAKAKILSANLVLLTSPVPYEEIILNGREFTTTISTDEMPNYYVLKYTVPVGESGYYSYNDSRYGANYRYICNEEQYEALCNRIENEGEPVSTSAGYLEWETYDPLSYWLEERQDYYFISAWKRNYNDDAINLTLIREIDVNLDSSGATSVGTTTLYSKGSEWCDSSRREWYDRKECITCPEKSGYRFEGYYTAVAGQGTQVIDDFGNILPAMNELDSKCTVYACWKPFNLISYQEIELEGRTFSRIVTGGVSPYYQVFKFTVPEDGGGFYSFYKVYGYQDMGADGYLCTPEQYEQICHKLEQNKNTNWSPTSTDCLTYGTYNFSLNYNLEAGKDYYFISAGKNTVAGEYKVTFEREITVTLEGEDADQSGTTAIYSNCGYWLEQGTTYYSLEEIEIPQKESCKFSGYFTGKNGQGIKVIDFDGEILAELAKLESDTTVYAYWKDFSPITYKEISLVDGKFSITGIAEEEPYYTLLKFKVPEHGSGYYSFDYRSDDDVNLYRYICTPAQYEALCRTIERDGCAPNRVNIPEDCLAASWISQSISYQLESGQEYYFVATRIQKKYRGEGEYQLLFKRDIEVELDAAGAEYEGTRVLRSMGDQWHGIAGQYGDDVYIDTPQRQGYLFAGYFTEKGGQGKMVIDQDGYIYLDNMNEFKDNTTLYALWEDENIEFKTGRLANGVKGVSYNQKLSIASKMTFDWRIIGELPEGLYLDQLNSCIAGRPTETGTKRIVIIAYNSQIRLHKEFTIIINELTYSDNDEEYQGTWIMDETGNWCYYNSGNNYYSNEWQFLEYNGESHWFYFGSDGHVNTGWFTDNIGKWYYLNPVSNGIRGAMQTGWMTDPLDGNRYYLDPQTGQMTTGWVCIDGIWYYFTELSDEYSGWKWDAVAGEWQYENIGRRPTGALELDKKRDE